MNAKLISLMTEFHLTSEGISILFGVKRRTVEGWRASTDNPNYRSMDRSYNKVMYKLRLKRIRRYLTQIRDM